MSFFEEQDDSLSIGSLDPPLFSCSSLTTAIEDKTHDSIVHHNQRMCPDIGNLNSSSAFFWDSTHWDDMMPDDDDNDDTNDHDKHTRIHQSVDNPGNHPNNSQPAEEAPRLVLGYPIPSWWTNAPSCNQVAGWVVRNAPCFWGCRRRLQPGATDRSILLRLNILCAFFAAGQLLSAVAIGTILYSEQIIDRTTAFDSDNETGQVTPNLWNTNVTVLILGILGLVVFISMIVTLWVIREVNLVGALHYMWTLLWIIPVELFLVIGLFDYHRVTKVWIRHWWRAPTLAAFRKAFCLGETYNSKCLVPLGGAPFLDETNWCQHFFNATDCTQIRDDAQAKVFRWTFLYYTLNGVWGVLLIALVRIVCKVKCYYCIHTLILIYIYIHMIFSHQTITCHSFGWPLVYWRVSSRNLWFSHLVNPMFPFGYQDRQLDVGLLVPSYYSLHRPLFNKHRNQDRLGLVLSIWFVDSHFLYPDSWDGLFLPLVF